MPAYYVLLQPPPSPQSSTSCVISPSTSPSQTFLCVAVNLLNALSSLVSSITSFISQNADALAVSVGVSAILGVASRISFFNRMFTML